MSHSMSDARYALRRLRKSPMFTIFCVLTLALGIGATTAIYSVVHAVLSPPPGVANIARIVNIYPNPRNLSASGWMVPWGDFLDYRAQQHTAEKVTAWRFLRLSYAAAGQSGTSFGETVDGEYFDVLGVRPALGRVLQPADDSPAAAPVAVISHGTWQRLFAGASDVLGRTIKVNGAAFEIVGVTPPAFRGLFNGGLVPSALWLPMQMSPRLAGPGAQIALSPNDRSGGRVYVKTLVKPGVTLDTVNAEAAAISSRLDAIYPLPSTERGRLDAGRGWSARAAADIAVNESSERVVRPMAAVVLLGVGLVFLVACTNIANLMIARTTLRRAETAVRLALGASRWRVVREEMMESAILAIAGGVVGFLLARVLLVMFSSELQVGGGNSVQLTPVLDGAVAGGTLVAILLAVLVSGLPPALQSTRADVRTAIAQQSSASSPRWRGRRYLITMQVAVSLVLVALAGLCVAQVRDRTATDVGFDLGSIAFLTADFESQQYGPSRVEQLTTALLAQARQLPNVLSAAWLSSLPVGESASASLRAVDGDRSTWGRFMAVTPEALETLQLPLRRGRAISARDTAAAQPVVVIDEAAARTLFNSIDVVGRAVTMQRQGISGRDPFPVVTATVVGVSAPVNGAAFNVARPSLAFVPLAQQSTGQLMLAVRTSGEPALAAAMLRRLVGAADADLAVREVSDGRAMLQQQTLFFRIVGSLATSLGGLALILALAGLFGVLGHIVAARRREIGVRLALGADTTRILKMVLRQGLSPVVLGLTIGAGLLFLARVALGPAFTRLMPDQDLGVVIAIPLLFLLAGAAACYPAARRAARIDPTVALRN